MNVLFDGNVYDAILALSDVDRKEFISLFNYKNHELLYCDTIMQELKAMPDKDKLKQIENIIQDLGAEKTGMFGFGTYDNPNPENVVGFGTYEGKKKGAMLTYDNFITSCKVHTNNPNNVEDRKIALIALSAGNLLVTNDKVFYKSMKKNNLKVMEFGEFFQYIKEN